LVYSFSVQPGATYPQATPVHGADGMLYGTTFRGGSADGGTLYRVNTNGSGFEILHHFTPQQKDGDTVESALQELASGQLAGVTRLGGYGFRGLLYRIDKNGSNYTHLHHFS